MTTAAFDFSSQEIPGSPAELVSAAAVEKMRRLLEESAPEITSLNNDELFRAIGIVVNDHMTMAGLLLAGHEQALQQALPGFGWSYQYAPFRQESLDTQQGSGNILEAIEKLPELILKHTPVFVTQRKEQRVEVQPYPIAALTEALWNAFIHQDLQRGSQVQIRHTNDFVQIITPGCLPDGITPANILHAPRQARNPRLFQILERLGLAGHDMPGVEKMVRDMLAEGKETPTFQENNHEVSVTFSGWAGFMLWPAFIEEETALGRHLSVDHLLLLRHLLLAADIDADAAAEVCQRNETEARQLLAEMTERGYLSHNYSPDDEFWSLQPVMFDRITSEWGLIRQRQLYYDDLKKRFIDTLAQRAHTSNPYIANPEISKLLRIRRTQVHRFMDDVMEAYPEVEAVGKRRWTKYRLK